MTLYTLESPKNYILSRLYSKRKADPKKALKKAILASRVEGAYRPDFRFPTPEEKKLAGDKFADEAPKRTRSEIFVAGMNSVIRFLKEHNTEDAFVDAEVEAKLFVPIDLTLRQVAFVAKSTDRDAMRLIGEIIGGLAPENVSNWKSKYELEKSKHEETKYRKGQIFAEAEALKKQVALLRGALHDNQIQDPTLHPAIGGRAGETGAVDPTDVRPETIEGAHAGDGGEGAIGDGIDDGSDND